MQVTETLSEGLKRAFAVIVPAADIESRRATRLSALAKEVNLPGFRPGKVPMPIIRQRFGGAVAAEVMEQSINEATQQLMADRALRPAMMPKLALVTAEPTATGPAADLEFNVELELMPEIPLPDFSAVTLTRYVAKVPAKEVDTAVSDIALRNRELVEIPADELAARGAHAGATKGDVLTIDFVGSIDGVAFPGGTATDTDVDLGGSGFIPGFAEQLEGLSPGDEKTIEVTFPEEYQAKNLAGKAASFVITAKQLRKPVAAPADDSLAEKIGFDTLENLRQTLTTMRQRRLDGLSRMRLKRELLDILASQATFTPPETLVDQEFEQIWKNLEASRTAGTLDEDDKSKTEDQLRDDYRGIAARRVRLGLLLGEIGRANNIVVTPEELNAAVRAEISRYPGQETQMMEFYRTYPAAVDALRGPVFEEKVVDYVIDAAQVTEVEISVAELEKDPEETRPNAVSAALPEPQGADGMHAEADGPASPSAEAPMGEASTAPDAPIGGPPAAEGS